jgi:hypothetical protein
MARFWLGPWVWDSTPGLSAWKPPAGSIGSLDLRSLTQCAAAGGTPQGVGLFVTANATNLGSDYTNLGTDPDFVLNGAQKATWQALLALPNPLSGQTLTDAVWETLTLQSDPSGVDRCCPLVPAGRRYELWLGGSRVRNVLFDLLGMEAAPLRELLRRQYRAIRQRCLDGLAPALLYRKILGYWVRKFGVGYRWFEPDDLPDESDLAPETTIIDDFNRADGTTIGNQLVWTEYRDNSVFDSWQTVSNRARVTVGATHGSPARAESDLSSSDNYAQTSITSLGSAGQNVQAGTVCRFDPASVTGYAGRLLRIVNQFNLIKIVSGNETQLGSGFSVTPAPPHTVKTQANGSSIAAFLDGVSVVSVTDTSITSGTRGGLFGYAESGTFGEVDSFEAADLAAAFVPSSYYYRHLGMVGSNV